jgi:DNA-binding MurR/RpiR family transcriptional regulator
MNLMHNLCALYNATEPDDTYHRALGELLRNLASVREKSIFELADLCHVSKATMERLIRRLGYRSLPRFRADVAMISSKFTYYNRVLPNVPRRSDRETVDAYFAEVRAAVDALEAGYDLAEIRRIVAAMQAARRVVFYTMGRSFVEIPLQVSLSIAGKESQCIDRYADQLADAGRLDPSCLAFIETIDFQNALDMEPVFAEAKRRGARIVLVTTSAASQYARFADLRIVTRFTETMVSDYGLQMALDLVHLVFRREAIDRV